MPSMLQPVTWSLASDLGTAPSLCCPYSLGVQVGIDGSQGCPFWWWSHSEEGVPQKMTWYSELPARTSVCVPGALRVRRKHCIQRSWVCLNRDQGQELAVCLVFWVLGHPVSNL